MRVGAPKIVRLVLTDAGASQLRRPDGTLSALAEALRRFWTLAGPYWRSSGRRTAAWLTVALAANTLANALLQLRLNVWLGEFFNGIDARTGHSLAYDALVFGGLAAGLVMVAALQIRLKASLQIGWRTWITDRLVDRWLQRGHSFMLRFKAAEFDNPDHRIGEDVRMVTEAAVDFAAGLINSALLLVIFMAALWGLSGVVHLTLAGGDVALPGYLVFAAIFYAGMSTVFTHWLGRPLVELSELRHAREGDFRFALVRMRENAEGAALLHGETVERIALRRVFERVVKAFQAQMSLETRLTLATTCFTVANPVVPLLLGAPQYLSGQISLGELMQISQAFVQVQLALGFFVDNYARLSDWMAGVNRIVRLDSACAVLDEPDGSAHHIEVRASTENVLRFVELTVASPDGDVMIDGASATIAAGEKVLIQGDVGVGKSTLFRAIAGLWPWGRGIIERPPTEETMFVSHRPYVPVGTLRMALAYPSPAEYVDTAAARQALTRCGLGRLADHLDVEDRWDQVLSEAEQQRLAFARLLLHRPAWIVIDEATSELDGAAEADLMAIFRNELAASTLVTVAQRSNLAALHDRTLALVRSPAGSHLVRLPDRLSQPSLLAAILGRR